MKSLNKISKSRNQTSKVKNQKPKIKILGNKSQSQNSKVYNTNIIGQNFKAKSQTLKIQMSLRQMSQAHKVRNKI